MRKGYVESILPRLSPEDREHALQALKHSCSLYDELGRHAPHDYEKENLLNVLSQRECYVIDNCSDWRKEYPKPENREKAFIISPALARENPNIKELILDNDRYKYGNIFSVGILPIQARRYRIMVDRIDEHFRYVFNLPALTKASKGKGKTVAEQKEQNRRTIDAHKKQIRDMLRIVNATDLPPPTNLMLTVMADTFKQFIKLQIGQCRYNVQVSAKVNTLCYTTLLLEDMQIRKEFDLPSYENVFGDMYILLTALYLTANILTRDAALTRMANYANVKCYHVPPSKVKRA
jgi:hypothetical protein